MDDLYQDLTKTLLLARRYAHQRSDMGAREFFIRSDNALVSDTRPNTNELGALGNSISDCQKCQLAKGRTKVVFGSGNPEANLMFIGEGPGRDEDVNGLPFVGAAGQLLTKIIEATKLRREDVYITNVVKCRPPNNRNPDPDEIAAIVAAGDDIDWIDKDKGTPVLDAVWTDVGGTDAEYGRSDYSIQSVCKLIWFTN